MGSALILAIDQGTTGTRAVLYDAAGRTVGTAYREFRQFYPRPGWVEHDAEEIWRSTAAVIRSALAGRTDQVAAIGITNQRETTVLWDRDTGKPVRRAIVWQDRRTAPECERLKRRGHERMVRAKTGLVLDPYFSATKIAWLLDRDAALRRRAAAGKVLFGTIDSWLLWKLTGGRVHATDFTNASRTLLLNIKTGSWDPELLRLCKIPRAMLPEVMDCGARFGVTARGALPAGIPIRAMMGDQQAALYGQGCHRAGQVKNTYGTGCFVVVNRGKRLRRVPAGLLATLACDEKGNKNYALEGSIFVAGAAVQWLRDGLGLVKRASETERMARRVKDSGGVTVVPALTGLGAPYWAPDARGMITGLTRGTTREHIVRATLESIAQQTADVIERFGGRLRELKVDGGATANRFLMQFQADILGIPILLSDIAESTAWGAAALAGRSAGVWAATKKRKYRTFKPRLSRARARELRARWKREISRLLLVQ
ncbi:MAG: glycerol kinase GlpK [Elusimicrobiota bacterium]